MKKLLFTQRSDTPHWVGDGFPVRSIFTYHNMAEEISPFLLMDYAGPAVFSPSTHQRGVGEHPHRGFETVTIVYSGEVEHRDSSGGGGMITPGDVQWMTAASGIIHEEKHSKEFSKTGGEFEMIQLWVNLPRDDKKHPPRYQGIKNETIPVVKLPDDAGTLRVIAGNYEATQGPAKTFTPINLWDLKLKADSKVRLTLPKGHTASLFLLSGELKVGDKRIQDAEIAIWERDGDTLEFYVSEDSKVLFLGGEPILEPIVGYGPFVMNTHGEIRQAFLDFESGKMGSFKDVEGTE